MASPWLWRPTIPSRPRRLLIGLPVIAATACVAASIVGYTIGEAQVVGWPMSAPNVRGAIGDGIVFGLPWTTTTTAAVALVRSWLAVWLLLAGVALTAALTGVVAFVLHAASAAV